MPHTFPGSGESTLVPPRLLPHRPGSVAAFAVGVLHCHRGPCACLHQGHPEQIAIAQVPLLRVPLALSCPCVLLSRFCLLMAVAGLAFPELNCREGGE